MRCRRVEGDVGKTRHMPTTGDQHKKYLLGPPKNLVGKRRKRVQSRRLAGNKKGEEVRVQNKGTWVEG